MIPSPLRYSVNAQNERSYAFQPAAVPSGFNHSIDSASQTHTTYTLARKSSQKARSITKQLRLLRNNLGILIEKGNLGAINDLEPILKEEMGAYYTNAITANEKAAWRSLIFQDKVADSDLLRITQKIIENHTAEAFMLKDELNAIETVFAKPNKRY